MLFFSLFVSICSIRACPTVVYDDPGLGSGERLRVQPGLRSATVYGRYDLPQAAITQPWRPRCPRAARAKACPLRRCGHLPMAETTTTTLAFSAAFICLLNQVLLPQGWPPMFRRTSERFPCAFLTERSARSAPRWWPPQQLVADNQSPRS